MREKDMSQLGDTFASSLEALRAERRELLERHGRAVVSEVTVAQAAGGLRDVRGLICDTSVVDPDAGLIVRGRPVRSLAGRLPEEIFFLLLIGRLPSPPELHALQGELAGRSEVPGAVWDALRSMARTGQPMAMLSTGLLALEHESEFRRQFAAGLPADDLWQPALDDALSIVARLPALAAAVYRIRYGRSDVKGWATGHDWADNYGRMLGIEDAAGFAPAMRLAAVLQCDHEAGNVCALTCHTVGSVLSDPYLAVSAGFNGLAGPLHGLASQVSARWVLDALDRYGGVPSDEQIREYAWETLQAGRVIPGYGHAVLRGPDPRFTAMIDFATRHFEGDEMVATVARMADVIPGVLREHGRAKNPWPNVDAGTGAVWHHFGIAELPYYTVPFAISLALGMLAQYVINRALRAPIVRPRSVTSDWIRTRGE
jgi:citrate synthase